MTEQPSRFEENAEAEGTSIISQATPETETGPTTGYSSRKVMLRSERRDQISIDSIEQRFSDAEIPDCLTVVERTNTYFGPELLLAEGDQNYLLTAPGPDTHLLLWREIVNDRGFRQQWSRIAEVQAIIDDTTPYEVCDQCGYPIRTEEHERLSTLGRCPE